MTTRSNLSETLQNIRAEFGSATLGHAILAGLVVGLLQATQSAAFASLIFEGELSQFLARGIGAALWASVIGLVVTSFFSSLPNMIGGAQNVPAAILGLATSAIAATVLAPYSQLNTVLAVILIATLATGAFLFMLGVFKLAGLVRYLPYPVIGGFLAGTGWLMLIGGIGSMAGVSVDIANLGVLFAPETAVYWLPGLILGVVILIVSQRTTHALFLPVTVIAIIGGFYLIAILTGNSLAELGVSGWLLGPFPDGNLWQPLTLSALETVDWSAVFRQLPTIATAVVMSAIALLLNASALEVSLVQDIDMNREMRSAGVANLLSGMGSGMTGYQQLGLTTMNGHLNSPGRLPGLVAAVVCAIILFAGGGILELIPRLVFGAILVFLGLNFLYTWVFSVWDRLPRVDHAIIILILAVIVFFGFLPGVLTGIVATALVFILNYSGVEVVRHSLTAEDYRSRVTRTAQHVEVLASYGDQISILFLQGYLFFGTANSLLERLRARLGTQDQRPIRYLLMDFSHVTGLDSTALLSFSKMAQLAGAHGVMLVISGMKPELLTQFSREVELNGQSIIALESLDRALEWCESRILHAAGHSPDQALPPLRDQLGTMMGDVPSADGIMDYLVRREVAAGIILIRRGDPPDAMYLIESGQLTAQLARPSGEITRLETMTGGRIVGEVGLFLQQPRSADVVVDTESVVYCLTKDELSRMGAENPELAAALQRLVIRLLSERVAHLSRTVEALQQ